MYQGSYSRSKKTLRSARWFLVLLFGVLLVTTVSAAADELESSVVALGETIPNSYSDTCTAGSAWMREYNLIVLNDLSTNSDVEGKTFVGGDLVSSNSANFAIHLSDLPATVPSLEIAGNVVSGNPVNVNNGSVLVDDGNTVVFSAPNVGYDINGRRFNVNSGNNGGTAATDSSLTGKASQIDTDVKAWSAALAQAAANNTITPPAGQPGPFNFEVNTKDADGVAIFHISDTDLFENDKVQQIEIKNNVDADVIIINVNGTDIDWNHGNMVGSWLTGQTGRAKTIWNFYNATNINLQSRNFMGAILAPNATVTTQANIDGVTAVNNLNTTSEIHLPLLDLDCSAEPETGSIAVQKYIDVDQNGVYDSQTEDIVGEGWTITVKQNDQVVDSGDTNATGQIIFEDLPHGTYQVCEEDRAGYTVVGGELCREVTVPQETIPLVFLNQPNPDLRLNLTAECAVGDTLFWRVTNDEGVDIDFTWSVYGNPQNGSGVAKANTRTYFTSTDAGGANTTKIFWDNPATTKNPDDKTKAHNNQQCVYHVDFAKEWTGGDAPDLNGATLLTAESSLGTATCTSNDGALTCTYSTGDDLHVPFGETYSVSEAGVGGWTATAGIGSGFTGIAGFDMSALPDALIYEVAQDRYCENDPNAAFPFNLEKFCTHTVENEKDLQLERLIPDCFDADNDQYRWRVRNPHNTSIDFTLTNPAGDLILASGTAAPNSDTTVYTAKNDTTFPTILRVDGLEQPNGRKNPNVNPCTPPLEKISPVLECVAPIGDTGMYRAFFGYNNPNSETVEIPVGPANKFTPAPENRGQPTEFAPGRTPYFPNAAFSVDFDGSNLVWTLNGKTATASDNPVQRCEFHVEVDKEWTGDDAPSHDIVELISASSSSNSISCDWDGTDLICSPESLDVPAVIENDELIGQYTVSEDGLPEGWNILSGIGDFSVPNDNCEGKFCTHTVVNEKEVLELERLIPDCFDAENDQYRWRVRNANDVSIDFTLTNPAGDVILASGTAVPNGDTVVYTAKDDTTFPTILRVNGVEQPKGRKNPNVNPCAPTTGKITVVKLIDWGQAVDEAPDTMFNFTGDIGAFILGDGDSETVELPAGSYDIAEVYKYNWGVQNISCDGGNPESITRGVNVELAAGDDITCTFTNTPRCVNPRADLSAVITWDENTAMAHVTNDSDALCVWEVGMASYKKYNEVIDEQDIFDWTDGNPVPPGETIKMTIDKPQCAVQIDVFIGEVLLSLDGNRYGSRLLAWQHLNQDGYCERPASKLDGYVLIDNAGSEGLTVSLTNLQADGATFETTTNMDGYYAFRNMPSGNYQVTISGAALDGIESTNLTSTIEVGSETPAVVNFDLDSRVPTAVTLATTNTSTSNNLMVISITAAVLMLATLALWRRKAQA